MARPKQHPHERRSAQLPPIRLTEAELAHLQMQARQVDLSVTEIARQRILTGKVTPRRGLADAQLLSELNRIGVNLNQIAHALHCGRSPGASLLTHALSRLERVFNDIETRR